MKKQQLLFISALLSVVLFINNVNAEKYRVNNTGGVNADYTDLQIAIDAASHGDTIYVEPSSVSYGSISINKKLTIFGPGYFLSENPETQANPSTARITDITLEYGSDTSLLAGLNIEGLLEFYPYNYGDINNVVIMRNKIFRIHLNSSYSDIGGNNNMILQNYIHNSTNSSYTITIDSYFDGILFQNNYIANTWSTYLNAIEMSDFSQVIFSNNVISGDVLNYPSTQFENNIFIDATISDTSAAGSFDYNIANTDILPYASEHQIIADLTTIFDDACETCASTDGQYQIEGASAAFGYANDYTECGMFGGSNPYILSGMPPIPAIFDFKSPSSAADSLSVTIKIKSHK